MSSMLEKVARGKPLEDIMIIDFHNHLTGPMLTPYIPWNSINDIISSMDRYGIDKACLSGYSENNQTVLEAVSKYPDRLIGFIIPNPHNGPEKIKKELEHCFSHQGILGIGEVIPASHQHSYPVDGPNYIPVWEFALSVNCPVMIHSGPIADKHLCGPRKIEEVVKRYPELKVIIAHCSAYDGSWDQFFDVVAVANQNDNVHLDISGMGRHYGVVEYLVKHVDVKKILFGSDGTFLDFSPDLGQVLYAEITEEEKKHILGNNAARLLGLDSMSVS